MFSKSKKISRHFSEYEVFHSNTAEKLSIDNSEDSEIYMGNILNTANKLDLIRDSIGEPILVNSWYRTPVLNLSIGGATNSQHTKGEAADIRTNNRNKDTRDLFEEIRLNHDFDQLILEFPDSKGVPKWIHVSFKKDSGLNRNEVLVATKGAANRTIFTPYSESNIRFVHKKTNKLLYGLFGIPIFFAIYLFSKK